MIKALKFSGALTADFRRFYSVRLSDELERSDYAELFDLINWLPRESAYMAIRRSGNDVKKARTIMGWSVSDDVAWSSLNMLQLVGHLITQQFSERRREPPPDIPSPASDEKPSVKRRVADATAMARAFMAGQS